MLKKLLPLLFSAAIVNIAHAAVPMPASAAAYPAPTTKQMNVAKAYFMLFGRIPDTDGMNYWASQLSNTATFGDTVNFISTQMRNALVAPVTIFMDTSGNVASPIAPSCTSGVGKWDELIEYVWANALGRAPEDENLSNTTQGIRYWQCQARMGSYSSPGQLFEAISSAATTDSVFSNRMVFLESAIRLQMGRGRVLNYNDSNNILLRVRGTNSSFNDAYAVLDQLTNGTAMSANIRWETPASGAYTRANVLANATALTQSEKSILDGTTSISGGYVHKNLVWYNRSGRMMLAHVFLPPNYQTSGTYYPAIVSVYGGGWNGGMIEKLQRFNTTFTRTTPIASGNAGNNFIVLAPSYRSTSYIYQSTADIAKNNMPQEDIDDFITLARSPSTMTMLGVDTSKVSMFGHSAGGHLLNLVGSTKSIGRVATLAPVSNLSTSGTINNAKLIPYINKYLSASAYGTWTGAKSPIDAWLQNKPTTSFYVQHGATDDWVPQAQTKSFRDQAVNNQSINVTACSANAGHMFFEAYSDPNLYNVTYSTTALRLFQYFSGITPSCPAL